MDEYEIGGTKYRRVETPAEVDEILINAAEEICDGWYLDSKIDWEDVFDRLEGTPVWDWVHPDFGNAMDSAAMRKIKREVNKRRREG